MACSDGQTVGQIGDMVGMSGESVTRRIRSGLHRLRDETISAG